MSNKRYVQHTGSGYVIINGTADKIWLCHNKQYVKQTGCGYVIKKGM